MVAKCRLAALLELPTVKAQLLFALGFPNSSQIDGFILYIKNEILETEKNFKHHDANPVLLSL